MFAFAKYNFFVKQQPLRRRRWPIQHSLFSIHHSSLRLRRLAKHSFDHVGVFDTGEALVEALEGVAEAFVVDA